MSEVNDYIECPYCGEDIKAKAIKCKHCQSMLNEEPPVLTVPSVSDNHAKTINTDNYLVVNKKREKKAKSSLIMGIIGLVLSFLPFFTFILSGLGLLFGFKGIKSAKRKLAIIGIITSTIGLIINLVIWIPLSVSFFNEVVLESLYQEGIITNTNDLNSVARKNFVGISGVKYSGDANSVVVVIDNNVSSSTTKALKTMLSDLGFSSAVADRMFHTRALDGTQSAEGGKANATWTFHPNSGLQIVFERK